MNFRTQCQVKEASDFYIIIMQLQDGLKYHKPYEVQQS